MKRPHIRKFIACNIPMCACNLKCHYCYISQLSDWEKDKTRFVLDPEKIGKALSRDRLEGQCIINLTGRGETLIPKEMPGVIRRLLEEGHYLEVVTNGTLTNRFDEISMFSQELLKRLEFKFSFHYLELLEHKWIDVFFGNVKKMRDAGCSFTIELMPNDDLLPYIQDIKRVCLENVGAMCHLTIGRDDTDGRKILTKMPVDKYIETWSQFDSNMFDFKYSVFDVKRTEFCYAGMWTLYVDLSTGEARQCYGFKTDQNIYDNMNAPLYFRASGRMCKQPYCYNAHAFMALGVIPEVDAPTYKEIRDRIDESGKHWLTNELAEAFSCKLSDDNETIEGKQRILYYFMYPIHWIRILIVNRNRIINMIREIIKKT